MLPAEQRTSVLLRGPAHMHNACHVDDVGVEALGEVCLPDRAVRNCFLPTP